MPTPLAKTPEYDTVSSLAFSTPTEELSTSAESSEAASLHGHKAKTPIIAGSVIGGLMGIAYIIGFTIYFVKRRRRRREKENNPVPTSPPISPKTEETIIIPPDPAVLLGLRHPGENVFGDGQKPGHVASKPSTSHPNGNESTERIAAIPGPLPAAQGT